MRSDRRFASRAQAGQRLALALRPWQDRGETTTVVALPRGGVSVGAEVARSLRLPLRTWAVRKLAEPSRPELALGAVAPGGVRLWDQPPPAGPAVATRRRQLVIEQERELGRRQRLYGDPDPVELRGRELIVVDDGIATGCTVRAALQSLRQQQPSRLILAVPVCDAGLIPELLPLVDELVVLHRVRRLRSVGEWYAQFEQVDDGQVLALLAAHRSGSEGAEPPGPPDGRCP